MRSKRGEFKLMTQARNLWFAGALALCWASTAANAADPVVEFYNVLLNHYFITIDAAEAQGIDQGAAGPGWHRTARVFGAYAAAAAAPAGAVPVCRFYGNLAQGGPNSHFYTVDPQECVAVKRDPGWLYEGIAFYARALVDGVCAGGTVPVLRNYNQRFAQRDSNHRYTTDRDLYDEMTAIGWSDEGAVICADPGISTPARTGPVVVSGVSTLAAGCDRTNSTGTLYVNAEVEPHFTVNPLAPDHFIGAWQQDRWSNGGARGLVAAASFDGGRSWTKSAAPFSRCTGGNAANGGDYWRASDPWVAITPDGTAFQIAIAFGGGATESTGPNVVAVSRSRDGGVSWESPRVLKQDGVEAFNDKEAVSADPTAARYVYAVWDRSGPNDSSATWFARTTDGGDSWEPARMIYDPGPNGSTLNNQIVVLPDGTLINFFSEFSLSQGSTTSVQLALMRSIDKGLTWSARVRVADSLAVGTSDPDAGTHIRDGAALGHITADRQGRLFVVWQDARLSAGLRDAVLLTSSNDGGLTWTNPVRVNSAGSVPAFVPSVAVARDGTIGVTYFDFRNNTPDRNTLLTDYWLARSRDGVTWTDTHVAGTFDYAIAPSAGGLFLGDYQGIATVGNAFVPFFARTNANDFGNRSDIVAAFIPKAAAGAIEYASPFRAESASMVVVGVEWARRAQESLVRRLQARARERNPGSEPRP